MAKEGSVAPKERVNIVYKPATGDQQEEVELPFKTLVVGDFTLKPNGTPLEERLPASIDKDNFNEVLEAHEVELEASVPDCLSAAVEGEDEAKLAVKLSFKNMKDFTPDAIAEAVPELKQLMELREALKAVKGPMGNVPEFRKKIQAIVQDADARDNLLKELNLDDAKK